MRIGSLVKFMSHSMRKQGYNLGLIIREYNTANCNGIIIPGFYYVLTQCGEKLVSDRFMKEVSVDETW